MSIDRGLRPLQIPGYEFTPPTLLTNGDFRVWQRGYGPFTGAQDFCADEWKHRRGVAGDTTQTDREASVVLYPPNAIKVTASVAVGGFCGIAQGIEAWKSLEGQWLTFSIWVKSTISSSIKCFIGDDRGSGDREWTVVTSYDGSNEWKQMSVCRQIRTGLSPDTIVWPHSYGIEAGVTSDASGVFYLDGAMLVVGKYPEGVPFIPINQSVNLSRCKRYYQDADNFYYEPMFNGNVTSGQTYYDQYVFVNPMAATPTVTLVDDSVLRFPAVSGAPSSVDTQGFYEPRTANATGRGYFASNMTAEVT